LSRRFFLDVATGFGLCLAASFVFRRTTRIVFSLALGSSFTLARETLFLFRTALGFFLRATAFFFFRDPRILEGARTGFLFLFCQRAQHHATRLGLHGRGLGRLGRGSCRRGRSVGLRGRRRRRLRGIRRFCTRSDNGRPLDFDNDSLGSAMAEGLADDSCFRPLHGQGFGRTRGMQRLFAVRCLVVSHARLSFLVVCSLKFLLHVR
jgi:hypothetical protein